MRKDVLEVLKQYKHEILIESDNVTYVEDWWHYLDDIAIDVHDYTDTGKVHVNLYNWFEDCGTVDMIDSYEFTIEEFKNL
jgi:hypothetical protein